MSLGEIWNKTKELILEKVKEWIPKFNNYITGQVVARGGSELQADLVLLVLALVAVISANVILYKFKKPVVGLILTLVGIIIFIGFMNI